MKVTNKQIIIVRREIEMRRSSWRWGLETALVTKTAQDAVEAVHESTPLLIGLIEERGEVQEALATICELLGLNADFLEGEKNEYE